MSARRLSINALFFASFLVLGCAGSDEAGLQEASQADLAGGNRMTAASKKKLDPGLCSLTRGGYSLDIDNPYFPLQVGSTWNYEGEEDGELVELRITVLNVTETVGGVTTRVIEEREWIDGELVEVSLNYYAQASDGTVCYFGEAVDIYHEDGTITHEGAWRADSAGNAPGIIMPASPVPGVKFPMEVAPGIAEDEGTIVGIGPIETEAGLFVDTIRVREFNPLDGDKGFKVFADGVGLIIDGPAELVNYTLAP